MSDWDDDEFSDPFPQRQTPARGRPTYPAPARSRAGRRMRIAGALIVAFLLASSPWWGRVALSRLEFFQLRKIEIEGLRYMAPAEVAERLQVDTSHSIWTDMGPVAERVRAHPQVADVRLRRRLPGTLVVRVTEHMPVAVVATRSGFEVLDGRGVVLPVDPSQVPVNLPILVQRDTILLRLLAGVRAAQPALFERISEARRIGNELRLELATVTVLTMADVTVQRLVDILPVERDLASKQLRAAELDLRYREQVIARLP